MPRSYWLAVPTPLFIYISQLLRDSYSVSQQPPIWEPPSHYSMEDSFSPQVRGGSNSDRDGCLVNTDSALWRESCKFSSFPARTRVPASAGGGQKLLLSHSCPRPCGEMRRVLTLRTQDPALPRYQDYLVFSTLTCTHIMNEPLGLELHYIPICFGPIFCTHLFHYI